MCIHSTSASDSTARSACRRRRHCSVCFCPRLGIYLDCDVSMKTHVSKVVSSCFAVLRRLRSIRSLVTRPVFVSLVVSLVLSCLDYGNATLAGITDRLMDRLRSVLNASARLIYASRRTEHVTPLFRDLHWLRYPDRIDYKLAVLVYRCLQGLAPSYLADEFTRVSEIESRRNLRSASTANLVVPRFQRKTLGGRAFPVQRLKHGTAYRHMSHHLHRWRHSNATSRLSCS